MYKTDITVFWRILKVPIRYRNL